MNGTSSGFRHCNTINSEKIQQLRVSFVVWNSISIYCCKGLLHCYFSKWSQVGLHTVLWTSHLNHLFSASAKLQHGQFLNVLFCLISSPNTGMLKCICSNKMNIISFVRLLWKGASYLKAFCPYGNEIFSIHCISNKMYEMWEEKTAWINRQKSNVFSIFAL